MAWSQTDIVENLLWADKFTFHLVDEVNSKNLKVEKFFQHKGTVCWLVSGEPAGSGEGFLKLCPIILSNCFMVFNHFLKWFVTQLNLLSFCGPTLSFVHTDDGNCCSELLFLHPPKQAISDVELHNEKAKREKKAG